MTPLEDGDERGYTIIESGGHRWEFRVVPDDDSDPSRWVTNGHSAVKNGTKITFHWLSRPWSVEDEDQLSFTNACEVVRAFAVLNPHARFEVLCDGPDESLTYSPTATTGFRKLSPRDKSSPHCYDLGRFRKLLVGYLEAAARGERVPRTVRELIETFAGLSGTRKRAAVAEAAGVSGMTLADLIGRRANAEGDDPICRLLRAMQDEAKPVPASTLGRIGKVHLQMLSGRRRLFNTS